MRKLGFVPLLVQVDHLTATYHLFSKLDQIRLATQTNIFSNLTKSLGVEDNKGFGLCSTKDHLTATHHQLDSAANISIIYKYWWRYFKSCLDDAPNISYSFLNYWWHYLLILYVVPLHVQGSPKSYISPPGWIMRHIKTSDHKMIKIIIYSLTVLFSRQRKYRWIISFCLEGCRSSNGRW